MPQYDPGPPPADGDLGTYLQLELKQIAENLAKVEFIQLTQLHVEPDKLRTGMIALADGTDWDPGSGQGVYAYYNGSWNKLG